MVLLVEIFFIVFALAGISAGIFTDGFGKKMIKLMSLVATNRLVSRTFFQIMHSVPTEHNGVAWFAVTFGLNQKCIYTQLSL